MKVIYSPDKEYIEMFGLIWRYPEEALTTVEQLQLGDKWWMYTQYDYIITNSPFILRGFTKSIVGYFYQGEVIPLDFEPFNADPMNILRELLYKYESYDKFNQLTNELLF